jgi:hypothetical protein
MSGCLICFVEKDMFSTFTEHDVIDPFKKMKRSRREIVKCERIVTCFTSLAFNYVHVFFYELSV